MHILRQEQVKLLTLITQIERNLLLQRVPKAFAPFPVYVLASDARLIKRPKCQQFCSY